MPDARRERVQRELFLAAFGANVTVEPWVTDRLTVLLEEEVARAGDTLFSAGDLPDFYYLLREGRVQLVRPGSAPWIYQGPSVFGMSDTLLERPRVRTALALTDIQAMKVQSEALIELLEDSFALARAALVGSVRTVAALEQLHWGPGGEVVAGANPAGPPGGPLDTLERLAILMEVRLLRRAGVQILSDLAAETEISAFEEGTTLFERGRGDGRVHILLEGQVEATRQSPDAIWRGDRGAIVGGVAAFGDPILAWQAVARTRGRSLTFRVADWLDLMEENFDMVRTTLGELSLQREELLERSP
jgi:CRP-like cAMP-binding protein